MLRGLILLVWLLVGSAQANVPVFEIDTTDKTALQVGQELGRTFKKTFPDIEQRIDSYLKTFVTQDTFNQWIRERVTVLKPNIDQEYRDEVEGIASTWKISSRDQLGDGELSLNEYWLLQLIPDVGRRTNCSGFGVWGKAAVGGATLVGRNMDWRTSDALRSLQAITVYRNKKGGIVNIGFAGYVAIISGFNQDGLFLAHLDSPLRQPYTIPANDSSIVFDLRKTLSTQGTIRAAAKELSRYPHAFSHNILLADRDSVQVLEQPPMPPAQLRTDQSDYRMDYYWGKTNQIAVVNCFVLASSAANCLESHDALRWNRFRTMANFTPQQPADVSKVMTIMLDQANPFQEIFNLLTVQSMVFVPETLKLYLYTVPISGQHIQPVRYQEFSHLLPFNSSTTSHWFNALNVLIVGALLLLIGAVGYGELMRKKRTV
ncbi:MAG: C45 family peptidase [Thiofilum sp.]|uniref:C45 family autoproteolytic acyltransferase/hydolase n=1 Tax=Thiofilum sp. TaxID=2212733 RepID=UPI0025E6E3E7|nr:C45 family peptidase [Thiofilum sp.]MBK8452750.1 hypothetical protein [Thiofilum sp.]